MPATAETVRQDQLDIEKLKKGLIGDRYLLKVISLDQTTKSGIFLPDQSEEKLGWMVGEVLGVGNGHRLEADATVPMFFKVGDRIACERFSGRRFLVNGTTYVIMNQTSCFGPA